MNSDPTNTSVNTAAHCQPSTNKTISFPAESCLSSYNQANDNIGDMTVEEFLGPSSTSDPRRLPLVPVLYLDENRIPVNSELLRPVPHFTTPVTSNSTYEFTVDRVTGVL